MHRQYFDAGINGMRGQVRIDAIHDEVGIPADTELAHGTHLLCAYRLLAAMQAFSNFADRKARYKKPNNLQLARGEVLDR